MTAMQGRTVLVTGAGGFIGPYVVEVLSSRGARIRAVMGAPGQRVRALRSDVQQRFADVTDEIALQKAVQGVDTVVHLAGPASVRDSFSYPLEYFRVHAGGAAATLEAARLAGVSRFVYVSSAEVYGQPHATPVSEDSPLAPRSPYGAAKAAAEFVVRAYAASFGLQCVIMRPFSIYGPGANPDSLVGTIARQARSGESIELADLRPVRDYCYVTDLADAVARACTVDISECLIVNIGSGTGTSVAEVADTAAQGMMHPPRIVERMSKRRPEAVEILQLVADVRRARDTLGWKTTTPLARGIEAVIHFDERPGT